nr:PREDICTED: uridine nucleosidase 1-like isoform X1 [Bemisia tabaci]
MLKHLVLRLLCAGLFGGAVMVDANPRLMVVDVDGGLDDEWALLTLLRAQHLGLVRILAITAVDGMTDINNVCVNTCRLLQVAQAPDIPMYRGIKNKDRETDYLYLYGKDGFGDLDWGWKPDLSRVKGMSAIEALARLTKEHPGEISLLCLGPLTNIAEAMRLQPDIASNLQEILIMGGNDPGKFGELGAEFNFLTDPESANAILTQAKVPIMLLPVETCLNIELNFPWRWVSFKDTPNPAIQMFNRIERESLVFCYLEDTTFWGCDLFLACGFINPGVFQTTVATNARVETVGPRRGLIVADDTKEHNVVIVTRINSGVLRQEVLKSAETMELEPAD